MTLKIHDFKMIKPITRGKYGKVYLACKVSDPEQYYAVKIMYKHDAKNKNILQQVVAERNALATCHSTHIVHLYYCLQTESRVYLMMEYLPGGDLKGLIGASGGIPLDATAFYTREIALAIEYLHRHHIIHRDLKPDNILIDNKGHLKLTDFGLSAVANKERKLHLNQILFTPIPKQHSNRRSSQAKAINLARTPNQIMSLTESIPRTPGSSRRTSVGLMAEDNSAEAVLKKKKSKFHQLNDSMELYFPKKQSAGDLKNLQVNRNTFKTPRSAVAKKRREPTTKDMGFQSPSPIPRKSYKADDFQTPEQRFIKRPVTDVVAASRSTFVCAQRGNSLQSLNRSFLEPLQSLEDSAGLLDSSLDFSLLDVDLNEPHHVTEYLDLPSTVSVVGSPNYLAPELLREETDSDSVVAAPIDWWALGVIVFEMLFGYTPFGSVTVDSVFNKIISRSIDWPDETVDVRAVSVIEGLLEQNPTKRFSITQLQESDFLADHPAPAEMPFVPNIVDPLDTAFHEWRNQLLSLDVLSQSMMETGDLNLSDTKREPISSEIKDEPIRGESEQEPIKTIRMKVTH